jgi:hypothetical protein
MQVNSKLKMMSILFAVCFCSGAFAQVSKQKNIGLQKKDKIKQQTDENNISKKADKKKIEFSPKKNRNPFLSLADIRKLKTEQERLRKLRQRNKPKPKLSPFERARKLIKLQGIINRQAIINGNPKREGDVVFGAKIVRMRSNYVRFKIGGKFFTKKL